MKKLAQILLFSQFWSLFWMPYIRFNVGFVYIVNIYNLKGLRYYLVRVDFLFISNNLMSKAIFPFPYNWICVPYLCLCLNLWFCAHVGWRLLICVTILYEMFCLIQIFSFSHGIALLSVLSHLLWAENLVWLQKLQIFLDL